MNASSLEQVRDALRQRDVPRAVELALGAVAASAEPVGLASILNLLLQAGAAEEVLRIAARAAEPLRDSPPVLLAVSEAMATTGALECAIDHARRCTEGDERGIEGGRANLVLAKHLLAADRVSEAEAVIERHMRLHPPTADGWHLLSKVHERQGRFAASAETTVQVARILRTAHEPWLTAVRLYLRAGNPDQAAKVAEVAEKHIGPNHILAAEWAGALHACGRFEAAAAIAQAGIAVRPENFALYRQAIHSLTAAGAIDAAAEACLAMLKSVEINPGVAFVVATFIKALPDVSARAAFVDRARAVNQHSLIGLLPGAGASSRAAPATVLPCAPLGTECFVPDDVITELADAFAGTHLPFSAQIGVWGERRKAGRFHPFSVIAYTVPQAQLYVRDGVFAIANANGDALDLCVRRPEASFLAEAKAAPVTGGLGRVFLVNSVGLGNYAHWSLDLLPQIAVARTHFPDAQVMIPGLRPIRYIAQTIDHFDLRASKPVDIAPGKYSVESLTVLSASVFPTSRHALQLGNRPYARHLLAQRPPAPVAQPRRLFVDRAPPQRRTAINRAELMDLAARSGFETIDPGRMSVAEQAAIFASASHVVGLHGAAMTNVMYCRPGTRILEIHSPEHSTTAFAICAFVAECAYRPHIGVSAAKDGLLWAPPQDMDFLIDAKALAEDFAWLLQ